MDWQFKVGIGTAVVFFLFPYAVKDMPQAVTWPGIIVGVLLTIWGLLSNNEEIPVGPTLLLIASVAGIVASVFWYVLSKPQDALPAGGRAPIAVAPVAPKPTSPKTIPQI